MKKVTGKHLFKHLMNLSFYGHFVAGENQEEIKVGFKNKTLFCKQKYMNITHKNYTYIYIIVI